MVAEVTTYDVLLLVGLVLGQAIVWGYFYHLNGPFRFRMHNVLALFPEKRTQCLANWEADKEDEEGQRKALQMWSFWYVILVHHGLGAILALVGAIQQNTLLFRIGLTFEIGEDFLHFCELAYSKCFPPTEMFRDMCNEPIMQIAMICHHSIGMFVGPFVFLYLTGPEWVEAQEIVAILLGAAVPQLMHYPFMPYMDLVSDNLTCGGRLTVFMVLFFSIIAVAGRVFAFPYLAWRTDQEIAKQFGTGAAIAIGIVCLLFCFFILLSTTASLTAFKRFAEQAFCPKPEIKVGTGKMLLNMGTVQFPKSDDLPVPDVVRDIIRGRPSMKGREAGVALATPVHRGSAI